MLGPVVAVAMTILLRHHITVSTERHTNCEASMKLVCRALALLLSSVLLDSTALRAQSERPRSWFDLKGGIAYESSGESNFASATALDLMLAGSFRLTGSTA